MKKRVKLLTTIASLCLAVALMAFGVYAASTATLKTTSTVSFETSNVAVTYNVTVAYGAYASVENQGAAGNASDYVYTVGRTQNLTDADVTTVYNLGDYTFLDSAEIGDTIVYTIEVTSLATIDYEVTLTNLPDAIEKAAGVVVSVAVNTNQFTDSTLAAGATEKLVVTYTLEDNTTSLEEALVFAPEFVINQ